MDTELHGVIRSTPYSLFLRYFRIWSHGSRLCRPWDMPRTRWNWDGGNRGEECELMLRDIRLWRSFCIPWFISLSYSPYSGVGFRAYCTFSVLRTGYRLQTAGDRQESDIVPWSRCYTEKLARLLCWPCCKTVLDQYLALIIKHPYTE